MMPILRTCYLPITAEASKISSPSLRFERERMVRIKNIKLNIIGSESNKMVTYWNQLYLQIEEPYPNQHDPLKNMVPIIYIPKTAKNFLNQRDGSLEQLCIKQQRNIKQFTHTSGIRLLTKSKNKQQMSRRCYWSSFKTLFQSGKFRSSGIQLEMNQDRIMQMQQTWMNIKDTFWQNGFNISLKHKYVYMQIKIKGIDTSKIVPAVFIVK
ncbi:Hypothetical_protein [Hexamita inflata]|uniref:Hypothetical_protein n=1 Tax=Hexamita inflata TaxID=28002 RepID=A0AA86NA19_9EUKA|nr:Hypothetical protein HINF_LOCUS1415 [Hexamita inflata]CAI9915525.1 Hypothetical protein HINF_LOCUS3170 [Hexamita inflata]